MGRKKTEPCDRRLEIYLPDFAADAIEILAARFMVAESVFARALLLQALSQYGVMAPPPRSNGHLTEASP